MAEQVLGPTSHNYYYATFEITLRGLGQPLCPSPISSFTVVETMPATGTGWHSPCVTTTTLSLPISAGTATRSGLAAGNTP